MTITTSREFLDKVFKSEKKILEHMVISLSPKNQKNIDDCFINLIFRFKRWTNYGKHTDVKWFAAKVEDEGRIHYHLIIRKPYIKYPILKNMWSEISGEKDPNIYIKSIKERSEKIRDYVLLQQDKHPNSSVSFTKSNNW